MAQNYWIDERNRTRPAFPEPPGPTPVQHEPYALSAFEKDADWLRRNPEQNPDPTVRVAPAAPVVGMVPDPSFGIRSGAAKAAAKAGTGLHPKGIQGTPGGVKGYAAELRKGKVKQPREVIFPGSKPGPRYLPSQRELEWRRTRHMSGAPAAPIPPPPMR